METSSWFIAGLAVVLAILSFWLIAVVRRLSRSGTGTPENLHGLRDLAMALGQVSSGVSQIGQQVTELEKERLAQFSALREQLRQAAVNDQALAQTTGTLAEALKSSQTRGNWGEVQLRRVLELSGLGKHIDFAEQASFRSVDAGPRRPDVTVSLPGGGLVAIDAKAPMAALLTSEGDPAANQVAHAKAVRAHIDALAKRNYPAAMAASQGTGANLGFTVMFVPMESLLAQGLQADPDLLDYALSRSVIPTTPGSLLALLKSVAVMWQHAAITDQAGELLELGQTLFQRLGVLAGYIDKVGTALQSAVNHYNQMVGSLESRVLTTCRAFGAIDGSELVVSAIPPERSSVRQIMAQFGRQGET
ncbi:MAG: DNA recombination protein RmuC [Micrococcales bacterium]|nr:DNA recombination protein RmuC [Micrococcales bacterium]